MARCGKRLGVPRCRSPRQDCTTFCREWMWVLDESRPTPAGRRFLAPVPRALPPSCAREIYAVRLGLGPFSRRSRRSNAARASASASRNFHFTSDECLNPSETLPPPPLRKPAGAHVWRHAAAWWLQPTSQEVRNCAAIREDVRIN